MNLKDLNVTYSTLEVDPRLGNYYVSVTDAGQLGLLLGPFPTHQEALDNIDRCREYAYEVDRRSHFYGFGTVRFETYNKPGLFNDHFGEKSNE